MDFNEAFKRIIQNSSLLKIVVDDIYNEKGKIGLVDFKNHVAKTHAVNYEIKKQIIEYCDEIINPKTGPIKTLEHEILEYLNDRVENYNIKISDLKIFLHNRRGIEIEKCLESLKDIKQVAQKDNYEKGLTITNEGQKRLNNIRENIKSKEIKKNIDYLKVVGTIFAGCQIFLSTCQYCENQKANELNRERNHIALRSLQIDSLTKSMKKQTEQVNSQNYKYPKDTSLVQNEYLIPFLNKTVARNLSLNNTLSIPDSIALESIFSSTGSTS